MFTYKNNENSGERRFVYGGESVASHAQEIVKQQAQQLLPEWMRTQDPREATETRANDGRNAAAKKTETARTNVARVNDETANMLRQMNANNTEANPADKTQEKAENAWNNKQLEQCKFKEPKTVEIYASTQDIINNNTDGTRDIDPQDNIAKNVSFQYQGNIYKYNGGFGWFKIN
jgi:hypothetical protein